MNFSRKGDDHMHLHELIDGAYPTSTNQNKCVMIMMMMTLGSEIEKEKNKKAKVGLFGWGESGDSSHKLYSPWYQIFIIFVTRN